MDDSMAEAGCSGQEDAAPLPLSCPDLLVMLREARAQHGLRHGDYKRYRRVEPCKQLCRADACCSSEYCTRRLRRLYVLLGFTHGGHKGRFQPRPLTPADVTDGRCVRGRRHSPACLSPYSLRPGTC